MDAAVPVEPVLKENLVVMEDVYQIVHLIALENPAVIMDAAVPVDLVTLMNYAQISNASNSAFQIVVKQFVG